MGRISVAQFSPSDLGGGAERSALSLHRELRKLDCDSRLFVGTKHSNTESVFEIPNDDFRNSAHRFVKASRLRFDSQAKKPLGVGRVLRIAERLAEPVRAVRDRAGYEDISHPGFWHFNQWSGIRPSIFHFHNLHGGYFDFRAIPSVCRTTPIVVNIRDGWLLSGHCAHGLECTRWKAGCGECPDLHRYPAIRRDRTSRNLELKREVFSSMRVHVVAPSHWMLEQYEHSMLRDSMASSMVIQNGYDDRVFTPGPKAGPRRDIGLKDDDFVVAIVATNLESNPWKDTGTAVAGLLKAATKTSRRLVLLQIGAFAASDSNIGELHVRGVPFESDDKRLAMHYRAADIILHCARAESFGNVLLEARACGAMVIATSVGGIPEQITSPEFSYNAAIRVVRSDNEPNGILLPPNDSCAVASAVVQMERDRELFQRIAQSGMDHVRLNFRWQAQGARFLRYYEELLST